MYRVQAAHGVPEHDHVDLSELKPGERFIGNILGVDPDVHSYIVVRDDQSGNTVLINVDTFVAYTLNYFIEVWRWL